MLTIEALKEYGADVGNGLLRCANNEALYLRLVGLCAQSLSTNELKDALKEGNLDLAFDIAHKLKGGVNNLSLTPVGVPLNELTELLRHKTPGDYDALYAEIELATKNLLAIID